MKSMIKIAVMSALVFPVAVLQTANGALQYTPPQAMVLTCGGTAPSVLDKSASLATFACKNGAVPQAVGITSGMADLLGLGAGAAALVASEAVPSMALPGAALPSPTSGPGTGNGSNGLGNNGNGSGNGSGANGSGSNGPGSGTGAGSNSGNNGNGSGNGNGSNGSGSGSGNGSGSGSNSGSNSGNNGSGSNGSGNGSGSNGNGVGNGSASGSNASGNNGSGYNGSGSGSNSGAASSGSSGGGFFGHLLHSVGQAVQQVGQQLVGGVLPVAGGGLAVSQPTSGAVAQGPQLVGVTGQQNGTSPPPRNAPTTNVAQAAGFARVDAWLLQQMRANKDAGAVSSGFVRIVVTPLSISQFYPAHDGQPPMYWGEFRAMLYYKGAPVITTGPQPGWVSAPQAVTYTVVPVPSPVPSMSAPYDYFGVGSYSDIIPWAHYLQLYGTSPLNYMPNGPLCRVGPRLPCDHQDLTPNPPLGGKSSLFLIDAAINVYQAALDLENYGNITGWEN